MAAFDPSQYETVDSRIKRFYQDHPNGRITTELVDAVGEVGKTRWIVKAFVWRDRVEGEPDGTGYAFEVDGTGMANRTSALENGETSAIGRALANIGYSGDKRASREEMVKANRPAEPSMTPGDAIALFRSAASLEQLNAIWTEVGKTGVTRVQAVIDAKDEMKARLS